MSEHYGMSPCWEQPGKQQWHLDCAVLHPLRYLRSRGPRRWRYSGLAATTEEDG
jgi:hypothetical protein